MQRAYWPIAFSSALLWTKAESGSVFTHKGKGNQQGQYSAILTKQACWARREIPSGQDRPILQSWMANQKAVFASNPAIYETRLHHKILFSFLIVPSRVPKILSIQYSRWLFWHSISCAFFQSRISSRFCYKIPNPEFQIREIVDPEKPYIREPPFNFIFSFSS